MIDNLIYFLLVNTFLLLTTIVGNELRKYFNVDIKGHKYINLSVCFYLGLIFSILIFRIISEFANINLTKNLILTLILLLFLKIIYKFTFGYKYSIKFISIHTIAFIFLGLLIFLYWYPNNNVDDSLSHIGSLHSVKYAWISNIISMCNNIPILGQNTGQALYVSLLNLLFGNKPFLYLSTLLVWAQFFLILLVFGILNLFIDFKRSISYTTAIFLGTSSLSITHILVIDSGSPLLMNGYTDTLIGIFSIIALFYLYSFINACSYKIMFLYVIILLVNFLSAPQNIIYILIINFIIFIMNYNKKLRTKLLLHNLNTFLICLIGIYLGGMLTPSFLQTTLEGNIHQTLFSKNSVIGDGFKIIPGIPFFYGSMSSGDWVFGNYSLLKSAQAILTESSISFPNLFWTLESIFINSIRILAIPLIGVFFLVLNSSSNIYLNRDEFIKFRFLTILLFTLGFLINFFIAFNGYKWEFSRFLIPGYFLSFIAFCIFLENLVVHKKISILFLNCIILVLAFGPSTDFIVTIFNNANYIFDNPEFLNKFFSFGPEIDKNLCFIK